MGSDRLIIVASNIHVGGAVGVAASFLDVLPRVNADLVTPWKGGIEVEASTQVASQMMHMKELSFLENVRVSVIDTFPRVRVKRGIPAEKTLAYTVFGPSHLSRRASHEIVGFADATMFVRPQRGTLDLRPSPFTYVADFIKRRRLDRYDELVVETAAMAGTLRTAGYRQPIHVLANTVPEVFNHPDRWVDIELPEREPREVRLFYPARGYPHKNHKVVPAVAEHFRLLTGRPLRVVVTLSADEFRSLELGDAESLINIGPISLAALPPIYASCDGVLFPSLLETFSSTPLEGQFMGKTVFAFDIPEIRDSVGDDAVLSPPNSPVPMARALAGHFRDALRGDEAKTEIRPTSSFTALDRATTIMELLTARRA